MLTAPNQLFDIGPLYYAVAPGPWGLMGLAASNKGLIHIQSNIPSEKAYVNFLKRSFVNAPEKSPRRLKPATDQLRLYLKGKLQSFDVPCRNKSAKHATWAPEKRQTGFSAFAPPWPRI